MRAAAGDVVVCSGVGHALALTARALHAAGARRVAVEDPSHTGTRAVLREAGLDSLPAPVDEHGLVVAALPVADAVLVTPAHQFPTGAVLDPERRVALVAWARRHDAVILEDDYDAEYRYDRHPIGALQGLDPERVVYCGPLSKTPSPALRLAGPCSRRACATRTYARACTATRDCDARPSPRSRASSSAATTTATCGVRGRSTAAAATNSWPRCMTTWRVRASVASPPGCISCSPSTSTIGPRPRPPRSAGVALATIAEYVIAKRA